MVKTFTCFNIVLFIILFLPGILYAQQNSVLEPAEEKGEKSDTILILIIPYNPVYYLSDSDRQIAEASGKDVVAIRDNFRSSLDHSLKKQFSEKYFAHSVLTDTTQQADNDLKRIYQEQRLKYEESSTYKKEKKTLKNKSAKGEKGLGMDRSSVPADNSLMDNQFMNVSFTNKDLLPELAARYENDFFIFLNQFEIRIDYNDCLDLSKKIYNRKLKVHYTIYDRNGDFITGDYVKVTFPSNTNHVNEIISRNFYQLARQLAEAL